MRLPALLLGIALFVLVWCCAAALARPPAPGEVTMRTAYEAHIQGRLHEAEAQYQALLSSDVRIDRADVSSLLGILYCQIQRPDEAARLLERASVSDWVAHEFMGCDAALTPNITSLLTVLASGVYMLLARRLMSSKAPQQEVQRLKALRLAAREFNLSLAHYLLPAAPGYVQFPVMLDMQAAFAKERPVVYRAYGDALAWSGDANAAASVFARGVQEGFWPHGPNCRPARARPVIGIPRHTHPARELFPHVALKLESALATILREFSNGVEEASDAWIQESAGLHSHGSSGAWHVLLLVVNGRPQQQGCALMPETCALLLSLPSVRHLRDGQVHRLRSFVNIRGDGVSQAKLSRMAPGTRVLPHAGPTNLRLRLQLPLRVQEHGDSRMRVGSQGWRTWTANESFVFDESCEHEVQVGGSEPRTVLLLDFANALLRSQQDYVSVAMRLDTADGLGDDTFGAESREAVLEWQQVQQRWQLLRGVEDTEL